MFDVVIIGAGIVGSSIARELSRYKLKTCVLEKGSDVATGSSKANSGIVHAGFDAKSGTLKAKLNVQGNIMFDQLSKDLDFPFRKNGSLVLCFNKKDIQKLEELKEKGDRNGVSNLSVLTKEQLSALEPNLNENVEAALYAPTGGIVCPYEMTIAFAENACMNGVEFNFNTEVTDIIKKEDSFIIETNNGRYGSKVIINAAGLFADEINNMVSKEKIEIKGRKGEYCLFDKTVGSLARMTLFQLPTSMGKGVLVSPTVDNNLLIGPTALDIPDKSDTTTTREGIEEVIDKARLTLREIPVNKTITSFSGIRAHAVKDDFIIGEASDVKGFINAAGIESPGLTSAPAIAKMIEEIVGRILSPSFNENFNPIRKGIPRFREMNNEERDNLIKENPSYGKVICRCETVTEGEILNAIHRPLGARTLDAVKRRTRAGMGRCQSGFCSTKIVSILARELNLSEIEITKFGGASYLLIGENKELMNP
ncbi:glycerol-3-phosphate dehydrogenase [Mobilisporobacter senegalensis]|uniref:Glycerol-3-phosphate dehydrogenase n=1 Tax=Mobilisporobacter senegalensis TaxID=1329262 RepID=A0A3N1XR55_9FIRM|nr:NAD(P)/FAD-dependent oxidoreductase [Mobilisporobacter senegalensis]ROR29115.1 glycerol-3-phosphate dehydrogenase [Mobilisporobacter senegalensis]